VSAAPKHAPGSIEGEAASLSVRYAEMLNPAWLAAHKATREATREALSSAAAVVAVDPKVVATLQARAALAGFELVPMADGSFVVARWSMTRALVDVAAVEAFLQQVGAK
jgi:hypothetical protein